MAFFAALGNEALVKISDSVNKFSVDFYKTLVAQQSDNFICSPLSVSMVLSMVAFGARGTTAEEMRSALHLSDDESVSKSGFESLIDTLNNVSRVDLQLANKIFIAEDFPAKSEFKELTAKSFKSEIQNLNFTNAGAACSMINSWCSAKTHGRIEKIIEPGDLNLAVMVLVNAVYFKGNWMKKFEPSLTSPKPFHINETTIKDVPMMYIPHKYNYGVVDGLDAIFVELPYANDGIGATSMFIILPNTVNGLEKAESNLEKINFEQFHNHPRMTLMELYIPKFKTESSFDLNPTLTQMGMGRIFLDGADFTGINEKFPLKISKVIQKAFIEVNEEGSEAAAVTAGTVLFGCAYPPPPVKPIIVKIDRPFIYAIVHGSTNTILFQGHITHPSI